VEKFKAGYSGLRRHFDLSKNKKIFVIKKWTVARYQTINRPLKCRYCGKELVLGEKVCSRLTHISAKLYHIKCARKLKII